ncbi:cytochrome P450 [Novosphingobium sp. MBES04]|uniref:cytochrome P450 n=1 Tax=Novosphingobium sp. MBES04 TaxID=1206458 RepID=UPI00057F3CBF|nr:cytochrome P450 [Novosphingobium sp. MBES04]GAM04320.1 cytochrome P450 [Novosphingobium sp. MBES04]
MASHPVSPAVGKPDHVPDALVYDFDFHYDPGLLSEGHARIAQIAREAPPVFWTPRQGGHWIVASHAAVYSAQRSPEIFSNGPVPYEMIAAHNATLPDEKKSLIPLPITVDPPVHDTYRKPLNKTFSPKNMLALKDRIRALAAELVAKVKDKGHCEFMSEVGEPLPTTIFLDIFGMPQDKQREYRDLVSQHLHSTDMNPAAVQQRLREVADVMRETILARRDAPQGDVLSMLWQSEFDGRPATLHDIENYAVMLFVAGLDTVMNGMGLGVRHLAMNPDLQARLRADMALVPEAADEILRRYTFTVPPRFVHQDAEFEGVAMKKGEMVLMFLPSADLDPKEFPSPEAYDLARENKAHIAFGTGPHRCLGSHLARIELQVLYEEMLKALPEFRLDPEQSVTFHGGNVIGPDQLHLVWDA